MIIFHRDRHKGKRATLTFYSLLVMWFANRLYIQQLYALLTLYLYVLYLSENKNDLCHLHHKTVGFCNRNEKCLQRGTGRVFK